MIAGAMIGGGLGRRQQADAYVPLFRRSGMQAVLMCVTLTFTVFALVADYLPPRTWYIFAFGTSSLIVLIWLCTFSCILDSHFSSRPA